MHQLFDHLRSLPSHYGSVPKIYRKNAMIKSIVHRQPILRSYLQYLQHEVPQQAFVFFRNSEMTDRLSYDDFLALQEILIFLFSCEHFKEDDTAGPRILLLSEQVVVGLRGDEERLSRHHLVGEFGCALPEGSAEAHQLYKEGLALLELEDHDVFRVYSLVHIALLVAELEGDEDLAQYVYDDVEVANFLLVVELV